MLLIIGLFWGIKSNIGNREKNRIYYTKVLLGSADGTKAYLNFTNELSSYLAQANACVIVGMKVGFVLVYGLFSIYGRGKWKH